MPPNLPAVLMLRDQQPPSPPTRWSHLFPGKPPLPPVLLPEAGILALCLSWLEASALLVHQPISLGLQASGWPSPSHLVTWAHHPKPGCHRHSCPWHQCLLRCQVFSGGALSYVRLFILLFLILLHWLCCAFTCHHHMACCGLPLLPHLHSLLV